MKPPVCGHVLSDDLAIGVDSGGEAQNATGHINKCKLASPQHITVTSTVGSIVSANDDAFRIDVNRRCENGARDINGTEEAIAHKITMHVS